jgi:glycerol-3-phosphate acyltransferase PlsY
LTDYLILVILVPVCYLLGSIPFGLIAGKLYRRIDVRDFGSGSTGMTNVVRTVGVPVGALVLLLDMGKGVGAVALARYVLEAPEAAQAAAALSAIAGHNWPVFIGFRGGRGTATGWGALLMLWPVAGLVATIVGLLLIAITRYVSLGSVTATLVGCAVLAVACLAGAAPMGLLWFAAIGCAFVVGRHRGNIERLLKGEERKLGQSV